jgi:hypothetical protein
MEILKQRGSPCWEFREHARIKQSLKWAMKDSPNWDHLRDDKKEVLEMVVHKIGRILNGDPEFQDSRIDLIGYFRLIEQTLEGVRQ